MWCTYLALPHHMRQPQPCNAQAAVPVLCNHLASVSLPSSSAATASPTCATACCTDTHFQSRSASQGSEQDQAAKHACVESSSSLSAASSAGCSPTREPDAAAGHVLIRP